jgi:hypothetical protein
MHNTTVRGALRGTTATLAFCAALTSGAAVAGATPLRLEPATETTTAPVRVGERQDRVPVLRGQSRLLNPRFAGFAPARNSVVRSYRS